MPIAQDIYAALLEDPDLEIGSHKTREEAAKTEADFRARQHFNNIKALSLASEPLKKDTHINALLNYLNSEIIEKESLSQVGMSESTGLDIDTLFSNKLDNSKFKKLGLLNPEDKHSKAHTANSKGRAFLQALAESGATEETLLNALDAMNTIQPEKWKTGGPQGDPDTSWVTEMVNSLLSQPTYAMNAGIPQGVLEQATPGIKKAGFSIPPTKPFKESSIHSDKKTFYGKNEKEDLATFASIDKINNALENMGHKHRVSFGTTGKLKLVNKNGTDIEKGDYHTPFPDKQMGARLFGSTMQDNPTSPTDDTTAITQGDLNQYSVAQVLNGIHWLQQQPTENQNKQVATAEAEVENQSAQSKQNETEILKKTPIPAKAVPLANKSLNNVPLVVFGAWAHPDHGTPTGGEGLKTEYKEHIAHTQAMMFGLCNDKGQFTKTGKVLLQDAYNNNVLAGDNHGFISKKEGVQSHGVVLQDGIEAILKFHDISVLNGATIAHDVAQKIAGQAFGAMDMPEEWDWTQIASQIAGKQPDPAGGEDIAENIVTEAADALDISATPVGVGNMLNAYYDSIKAHAIRLNAAYDTGDSEYIEKHKGLLADKVGSAPDVTWIPNSKVADAIKEGIDPKFQAQTFQAMGDPKHESGTSGQFADVEVSPAQQESGTPEPDTETTIEPIHPDDAPDDAYNALQDKAKKLHAIHEHDYTGSGLSEEEIQAEKDQASQEMKQSINDLTEALGGSKDIADDASLTAKMALTDHLDTDVAGVEKWLEDKDITGAITTTTEAPIDTTTPTEAPKAVDPSISALMEKHNDIIEHMYEQLYGKDNAVTSLDEFKQEMAEEFGEIGTKKAKKQLAVASKKKTEMGAKAQEISNIQDAKDEEQEKKDAEKIKQQAIKDEEKVNKEKEAQEVKEEKEKISAQSKQESEEAKAQALEEKQKAQQQAQEEKDNIKAEKEAAAKEKQMQKDANVLPSDPGDLDAMVKGSDEEIVGENMATLHARELIAHNKKYREHMSPETSKELLNVLEECSRHGADFDKIKIEMENLGDDFGTKEHLDIAREVGAKKAEFHGNHKTLTFHEPDNQEDINIQQEAFESGQHNKFTEFDKDGNPIKAEDEKDVPPGVNHHVLHSLTPIQKLHLEEMKKAKASGDEEAYQKAAKALQDSGIPGLDIHHSGPNAPKMGPPNPEIAKKKIAEGYVWHEETRNWILKTTLEEQKKGGGSSLIHGSHAGAGGAAAPFAVNEDGTPSNKNFLHNKTGLFGVGDGKPPTGVGAVGAISHSHINQNVLHSKLSSDGTLDNHGQSKNGITKLPSNYGHPADMGIKNKPTSLLGRAKAEFKSGVQQGLENKGKSGTPFLDGLKGKFFGKGYPMPKGTALSLFLKEYSVHDSVQHKQKVQDLLEALENSQGKKKQNKSV